MPATIKTGKAKRKELAFFFETEDTLEIIGKGMEEASINPSATVESVNDILGNTETTLSSYEKTTDLDPIYVEGGNKFSEWLDNLEETNAILDDAIGNLCGGKNVQDHRREQVRCLETAGCSGADWLRRRHQGR